MSHIVELKPSTILDEHASIHYFEDKSKADTELGRYFTEVVYDGTPDFGVETPYHWHENHDEWMEVLEGEMDVVLEQTTTRVRAGDRQVFIPRRTRHAVKTIAGVAVRFRERNDPTGRFKEEFFRDAFRYGSPPPPMHMMRACWDGDTFVSLAPGVLGFDTIFNYDLGGVAKVFSAARIEDLP